MKLVNYAIYSRLKMINETEKKIDQQVPVRCQIANLGSFWAIFQFFCDVGNLNIKITLLKSTFQNKLSRGHQRSPEVKNFYEIRWMIYQNDVIAVSFPE